MPTLFYMQNQQVIGCTRKWLDPIGNHNLQRCSCRGWNILLVKVTCKAPINISNKPSIICTQFKQLVASFLFFLLSSYRAHWLTFCCLSCWGVIISWHWKKITREIHADSNAAVWKGFLFEMAGIPDRNVGMYKQKYIHVQCINI